MFGVPKGVVQIGKPIDATDFFNNLRTGFNDIGQGLINAWYGLTGQTEKTSAFKAQVALDDSRYQRMAQDMEKAGLSKYTTSGSPASSPSAESSGLEKSIQLASALMDLKEKKVGIDATQAGIRKTNAEAGYIGAQTIGQENTNRTYDQKFMADLAQTSMQTLYIEAQKRLTETNGQFAAQKALAEIQEMSDHAALYVAQKKYYDQQTGISSIERNLRQKDLEKYEFRYKMELEKHAESIAASVAQRNHLSKEDELLAKDLTYKQLQINAFTYDYDFSVRNGLRTTDPVSRFMGVNLNQVGQKLVNQIPDWMDDLLNFRGVFGSELGLPSFRTLFNIPYKTE